MGKNLEISSEHTLGKMPAAKGKQTLAKRVREVLLALGGEAHRALVIEQVARSMGHDVRQIPEDLQHALILSFEENWRDERRRATYGFHLPFGEGSHRWGCRTGATLH
jgi:predicted transcriptional regulator